MLIITCPFVALVTKLSLPVAAKPILRAPLPIIKFQMPILPIIYSCETIQKVYFSSDGGIAPDAGAGLTWHATR